MGCGGPAGEGGSAQGHGEGEQSEKASLWRGSNSKVQPLDLLTGEGPNQYCVYVCVSTVRAFSHQLQHPSQVWLSSPFRR